MDIYIFGDIGGHFHPFMRSLEKIGVSCETATVPPDTVVIQVGDLVHRGPDGDLLVSWVDEALSLSGKGGNGRWVQLLGNHEGHHIGGPKFGQNTKGGWVDWDLSVASEKILKKWWGSKKAQMAAAVRRTDTETPRDMLVSHAGLTFQTWGALGFPEGAGATARALNSQNLKLAFAPGWLLGGYYKSSTGGMQPPSTAWASAAREVYPSLVDREMGFDQVHGHSTLKNWFSGYWWPDVPEDITNDIEALESRRFTRWTTKAGEKIYCIDQGLGAQEPHFELSALHVKGELLA